MTARHAHAMPFGATWLGDGRARFRLWAPGQPRVLLDLGGEPRPMSAVADGWHEADIACVPGARYRYILGDGTKMPDPASRFQPQDVHGPSELVDPRAYAWKHDEWRGRPWHEVVIY
jgi:1,4-alpha-glucan branching enzyme